METVKAQGSYLYYIPEEVPEVTGEPYIKDLLAKHELDYVYDGSSAIEWQRIDSGLDQEKAVIIRVVPASIQIIPCQLLLTPERQEWIGEPGGWRLGWWRDLVPKEASLRRERLIPGDPVHLRNGESWLIPRVRKWPSGTDLPTRLWEEDSGEVWWSILDEHREVWADSVRLVDAYQDLILSEAEFYQIPTDELLSIGRRALALNYRMGRRECKALGVWDTAALMDVVAAVVDRDAMLAYMVREGKKKAEDPSVSSGGGS